ncbi:MAG: 30S ribosomal protein S17 [Phycisphaerales bacterium]|nr:MAG: 30S ribosomal protein S17 [Phycisphaerales bacterium]
MTTTSTEQPAADAIRTIKVGVVDSDKRDKTRKVVVSFSARHPKYGKYMRKRSVLHVHDENNESRNGDRVEIEPCRPISKTKRWRLVRIVERAPGS